MDFKKKKKVATTGIVSFNVFDGFPVVLDYWRETLGAGAGSASTKASMHVKLESNGLGTKFKKKIRQGLNLWFKIQFLNYKIPEKYGRKWKKKLQAASWLNQEDHEIPCYVMHWRVFSSIGMESRQLREHFLCPFQSLRLWVYGMGNRILVFEIKKTH